MSSRRAVLALATLGLTAGVSAADVNTLVVNHDANVYQLYVDITIDAPIERVRHLFTDYNHLTRLTPSIVESEVVATDVDNSTRVRTRMRHCVLMFCVNLRKVEDLSQDDQGVIRASVVPEHSDFKSGQSVWYLIAKHHKTRVVHRARLEPTAWIPPVIGPQWVRKTLAQEIVASLRRIELIAGCPQDLTPSGIGSSDQAPLGIPDCPTA